MRLNYNHLRYFWAVAHNGNLTRTAEQLHVSQSALSLQIRKLEQQLGHDLFERRGKQLLLTEAGRLTLSHADVIFASGAELLSQIQGQAQGVTMLRVGVMSTLSRNFQAEFLQPILRRPDARVTVRSGDLANLLEQLEAHRLDVILTNTSPQRDAATPWIVQTLATQPISLVGHAARHRDGESLAETVGREPVVAPTLETTIRGGFDAFCEQHGVAPNFAAEVDDMALLRLLARRDQGVAITPAIVVQDELRSGELKEFGQFEELQESFTAITLSRRFPNPLLAELLEAFSHNPIGQH